VIVADLDPIIVFTCPNSVCYFNTEERQWQVYNDPAMTDAQQGICPVCGEVGEKVPAIDVTAPPGVEVM
jgi:hypothetical protein